MKYVVLKRNVESTEITERMKYIYDTFRIYTIIDNVNSSKDITVLKSIPDFSIDLLMIIGHDRSTNEYLKTHYKNIKEKNVVIIACNTLSFSSLKLFKDKNIYVPHNRGIINFYDGENYGFNFNITDEEIMLYRNREEKLENVLNKTFEKI